MPTSPILRKDIMRRYLLTHLTGTSVTHADPGAGANAGSNYVVGDRITISGNSGDVAVAIVTSIGGGGAVTGVSMDQFGSGYTAGNNQTTAGGSGTGLKVNTTVGTPQAIPLGLLERKYYIQYLAGSATVGPTTSLKDLKIKWMRKWIQTNSGTAPSQNFESDLWKAMVSSINIKPVTSTSTNIMNFWLNAT